MRFQVPQFIDIEDKIFGPLTLKQFIYLAGGAGIAFIFYTFLGFYLAVIPSLVVLGFVTALSFYKVNKRPFINIVESALHFQMKPKLYLWKKENKKKSVKIQTITSGGSASNIYSPRLTQSKLKDLSWSLDIKKK